MKGSDHKVITVDGPAASGKSTVARRLAEGLGFRYINSGAIYRAFALALSRAQAALEDDGAVESTLDSITVEVERGGEQTFLDGEDVTEEIRTREISEMASRVAKLPSIRGRVNAELKRIASSTDCVVDGRDIGTVVFPYADFKLFLEATLEERSRRRLLDYQRAGKPAALEEIQAELSERDHADRSRLLAPLAAAQDATVVNSTGQTVDQIVASLLESVQAAFRSGKRTYSETACRLES